jgi:hypothetical protein
MNSPAKAGSGTWGYVIPRLRSLRNRTLGRYLRNAIHRKRLPTDSLRVKVIAWCAGPLNCVVYSWKGVEHEGEILFLCPVNGDSNHRGSTVSGDPHCCSGKRVL